MIYLQALTCSRQLKKVTCFLFAVSLSTGDAVAAIEVAHDTSQRFDWKLDVDSRANYRDARLNKKKREMRKTRADSLSSDAYC